MRLVVLLVACSFDVHGVAVELADLSAAVDLAAPADLSAPDLLQPDLTPEPDLAVPGYCPQTPSLVACFRFEDALHPTTLHDDSMYGNDATATGASFPAGTSGASLTLSAGGSARVSDRASLDISDAITYEAWVKVRSLVQSGQRYGVIDDDGQYGMFILPNGTVTCSLANLSVTSPTDVIGLNVWQHVACTYDRNVLHVYVSGIAVGTAASTQAISTAGTNGLALAGNSPSGDILDGDLDGLRIWNVARTALDICNDAGGC